MLRQHLKIDSGLSCRNSLIVSWLAVDMGEGDDDVDKQFVLDWFDWLEG